MFRRIFLFSAPVLIVAIAALSNQTASRLHAEDATNIASQSAENSEPAAVNSAASTYYASWSYYKRNKRTGIVKFIKSGKNGPYRTRREAQSRVNNYLGYGATANGYYYYYLARVTVRYSRN